LTILCMAINMLITPLNDWVVRIAGIMMLASVFTAVFSTAKNIVHKK